MGEGGEFAAGEAEFEGVAQEMTVLAVAGLEAGQFGAEFSLAGDGGDLVKELEVELEEGGIELLEEGAEELGVGVERAVEDAPLELVRWTLKVPAKQSPEIWVGHAEG